MTKPVTMTVNGTWWALDSRGRWLVYDVGASRWRVSEEAPVGDPDPGSETLEPPEGPPEDLRADEGIESLSDRVKELVLDVSRQVEDECHQPIRFSALVASPTESLKQASTWVRSVLHPFRNRRPMEGEVSPHWFVLAFTHDEVLAYSCLYLPLNVDIWPRRMKDYVEIRERLTSWPRGRGLESITDVALGYMISLDLPSETSLPDRLIAPKGWGGMGRELVRQLEEPR